MIDSRYDKEADAIYIRLSEEPYAYGEELDPQRRIDYATNGNPVGVELLCASSGVDLRNLPAQEVIADLLAKCRINVVRIA